MTDIPLIEGFTNKTCSHLRLCYSVNSTRNLVICLLPPLRSLGTEQHLEVLTYQCPCLFSALRLSTAVDELLSMCAINKSHQETAAEICGNKNSWPWVDHDLVPKGDTRGSAHLPHRCLPLFGTCRRRASRARF